MNASIFQADCEPPHAWPIRFQDADFEHRFAWCQSPLEGRSRRWVPFGMPRLNQTFLDGVFFLFGHDPRRGEYLPMGTGVLIGFPGRLPIPGARMPTGFNRHVYAVTCHHVITHFASDIRVNTNKEAKVIELEPHDWEFIPGGPDLAAVDVTDRLFDERRKIAVCPLEMFADREFIDRSEIGPGEDGFMLGLFADHPGKDRNLVAARFGNLCLLADDSETIRQPNGFRHPSHLFDMRSRPGFSGSPVYIYRTPSGDLRHATREGEIEIQRMRRLRTLQERGQLTPLAAAASASEHEIRGNTFARLLGIHASQYHDRVGVGKAVKAAEMDANIAEGDELSIPNSIAVVVPAWEIVRLLELETFQKQRLAREEEDKRLYDRGEHPAFPERIRGA